MLVSAPPRPTFAEAFRFWLKLGCISFGGPTGQIAIMHAEVVEKRRWVSEEQFLHALNFCMLLPGPEAQLSRHGRPSRRASSGFSSEPPTSPASARTPASPPPSPPITAAVVGVILNMALCFAAPILFPGGRVDSFSIALCAAAFTALHWRKWNILPVVLTAGALGALRGLLFP